MLYTTFWLLCLLERAAEIENAFGTTRSSCIFGMRMELVRNTVSIIALVWECQQGLLKVCLVLIDTRINVTFHLQFSRHHVCTLGGINSKWNLNSTTKHLVLQVRFELVARWCDQTIECLNSYWEVRLFKTTQFFFIVSTTAFVVVWRVQAHLPRRSSSLYRELPLTSLTQLSQGILDEFWNRGLYPKPFGNYR